jgi:hypothetical protein
MYLRECQAMGVRARLADGLRRVAIDRALLGQNLPAAERDAALLQAVRWLGAAEIISRDERVYTAPADADDNRWALELFHHHLDPAAFDQAWADGQALTPDEAVEEALSIPQPDNIEQRFS